MTSPATTLPGSSLSESSTSATPATPTALLTKSRIAARRRCPREEELSYQLGYRAIAEIEAHRFGTLIHHGLEGWWNARGEARLPAALAAIASQAATTGPYEIAKAEVLLRGYDVRWGDEPYEAIGVELEYRAPLVNPETGAQSRTWTLAGKIDALVFDTLDGREYLVEHKTSGVDISPGSPYWARLRMDSQVSGYVRGAESLGHHPVATIYDVIGKPRLRPLRATPEEARRITKGGRLDARQRLADETPDEYALRIAEDISDHPDRYYQRATIVRLESELAEYDQEVWQLGRMMRDDQLARRAPKNPDACERYGSLCQFFPVCSGEASLADERLYQLLPHVHPELSESPATVANPNEEGPHATSNRAVSP